MGWKRQFPSPSGVGSSISMGNCNTSIICAMSWSIIFDFWNERIIYHMTIRCTMLIKWYIIWLSLKNLDFRSRKGHKGVKRGSKGAKNSQIMNICNQLWNRHLTVYNMTMVTKTLIFCPKGSKRVKKGSKGGQKGAKNGQIINICTQLCNRNLTVCNMTMVIKTLILGPRRVKRGVKGGQKGVRRAPMGVQKFYLF